MQRRSPELRAAARAAALTRTGDFDAARGALSAMPPERAEPSLAPALAAAIDFAEAAARAASRPLPPGEAIAPLKEAARAVARALGGVCPVPVGLALMAEAELVAPWMTLPVGACAGLLHEEMQPFLARHLMEAVLREAASPEEAALVVAHVAGAEAFAAADRGAALIYEGFAWLRAGQAARAVEAFARARAAGGDEAEVRRGELLCAMGAEAARGAGRARRAEGEITAGALAAKVSRGLAGARAGADEAPGASALEAALSPAVLASRGALPPEDRLAFDAATLALGARSGTGAVQARLAALAPDWAAASPPALRDLGLFAVLLGEGAALAGAAAALAAGGPGLAAEARGEALAGLVEAAAWGGAAALAREVFAAAAPHLTTRLRLRVDAALHPDEGDGGVMDDALELLGELDARLQPELDLLAELEAALRAGEGTAADSVQRARRPDPPLALSPAPEPSVAAEAWLRLMPAIPPPAPPPRPAWARPGAAARAILRLAVALRVTPADPPCAAASGCAHSAPPGGRGSRRGDRRSTGSRPGRS